MLPKEHGAYGYVTFPLVTAFAVAGISTPGILIAAGAVAGFLGHEAAAILLGARGVRVRREQGARAARWLAACAGAGLTAGVGALVTAPAPVRWWLLLPLLPAIVLAGMVVAGREKTAAGETAAALAFSAVAVPIALAGGKPMATSLAVAIPFALLFVGGTLAVRVVILRRRGGGDARATARTRLGAYGIVAVATLGLGAAVVAALLPPGSLAAAAPGLLLTASIATFPPAPVRLRALGWTLVGASVLTVAVAVAALR